MEVNNMNMVSYDCGILWFHIIVPMIFCSGQRYLMSAQLRFKKDQIFSRNSEEKLPTSSMGFV